MAEKELSGAEKSAIFLLALGEEVAPLVMKHMSEQEIQRISNYMSHMQDVNSDDLETVFEEFFSMANGLEGMVAGGKEYVRRLLLKTLDPKQAAWILNNISVPNLETGLEGLKWLDPGTIARFLQGEHPQTIAVILAHLDSAQAGAVIGTLPYAQQTDVLLRIAKLERVPPGVIRELDQVLQKELKATSTLETNKVGGLETVTEILNNVDQASEREIIVGIEEIDASLADEIRQLMFTFEDLNTLDDRGMQAILREVANDELTLALKTASEGLCEKIFRNMSQRGAEMLREELEIMGPVRVSDVEQAQLKVTQIAKRLESEGKIMIGGKGESSFV